MSLRAWGNPVEIVFKNEPTKGGVIHYDGVGPVKVEVIEGNVVITVEREDEAKFGPVSLVVL